MPVFPFQCSLRVNIVNGEWPARSCQAYCRAATHLTQTHYSSPQHFHLSFDIPLRSTYTAPPIRSEEHTSELQSLMRTSYAVFCLKTNKLTQPVRLYLHNPEDTDITHKYIT